MIWIIKLINFKEAVSFAFIIYFFRFVIVKASLNCHALPCPNMENCIFC